MSKTIPGLRAGQVVALGPSDWLVSEMSEKERLVRRNGWSPARIWTAQEILSLPWPTPPTIADIVQAFAAAALPETVPPQEPADE